MNKNELRVYEFGLFRLDANDRILLHGNRTVHLTEKVFNLLLLLVERSGHLVTKEELIGQVWPDSVVEESNLTVCISALRKALGERQKGGRYIETVPRRGYRFVADVREMRDGESDPVRKDGATSRRTNAGLLISATTTLAVLPLLNVSDDPSLEYFSDGITESIINALSKLPQLKVLARSTMFRFKGADVDPLEVGRQLNTDALLTGRIFHINDDLVIKLELINIREGSQIWGEQYMRSPADIFEVQEEISNEVSEKLKLRLTGEQRRQLAKRYTEDIEAYHLYLKGRYCWNKRTGEALKMAIEFFQEAITKDSDYALAYAGLADSYAIIPFYSNIPPKPAFEEARKATDRALEIDDTLAEAHASLGFVKEYYEWDWSGAGREYQKAINLNPNYATAHQWYGMYFMKLGRFERARGELKRALRFDPHSLIINADLGLPFTFKGQYEEAVEQYRKVLEIDQDFIWARFFLAWTYEKSGQYAEAIAEFEKAKVIDGRPEVSAMIARIHAVSGRRDEAVRILDSLLEESKHLYISSYYIALTFAGLDDKERALRWLEKAASDRNEWLVWLKVDYRWDWLRSEPRFQQVMRRIGFLHEATESNAQSRPAASTEHEDGGDKSSHITQALLALAYLEKGLFEEAIEELQRTPASNHDVETSALLGYALAVTGRKDEARKTLEELQERANHESVDPAFMASIHAGLREKDQAFECLEEAYEKRSAWLGILNVSSIFESLRSDPRFAVLLRRLGDLD